MVCSPAQGELEAAALFGFGPMRFSVVGLVNIGWSTVIGAVLLFVATFTISVVALAILLIHLPATFFLDRGAGQRATDRRLLLPVLVRVGKNVIGAALIVLGLLLSLPGIPGQGLLTVLVGLVLVDFPGKRRLQRKLLGRPGLRGKINRLRKRFGKPPLVLTPVAPEEQPAAGSDGPHVAPVREDGAS